MIWDIDRCERFYRTQCLNLTHVRLTLTEHFMADSEVADALTAAAGAVGTTDNNYDEMWFQIKVSRRLISRLSASTSLMAAALWRMANSRVDWP